MKYCALYRMGWMILFGISLVGCSGGANTPTNTGTGTESVSSVDPSPTPAPVASPITVPDPVPGPATEVTLASTATLARVYGESPAGPGTWQWLNVTVGDRTGSGGHAVVFVSSDSGIHAGTFSLTEQGTPPGYAAVTYFDSAGNVYGGHSGQVVIEEFGKAVRFRLENVVLANNLSLSSDGPIHAIVDHE